MYDPKLFENKNFLLKNLLEVNRLERERYDAYIAHDYGKIRSLSKELELVAEETLNLIELQKQLELEEKVKWKFAALIEYVYLKKEEKEDSSVFETLLQGILAVIQREKKELLLSKDRENYFALESLEQRLLKK